MKCNGYFHIYPKPHPVHPVPPAPGHHEPPHVRNTRFRHSFSEEDFPVFRDVFGSDISGASAMSDIVNAPAEVTILGIMAISLAALLRDQLQQKSLPTGTDPSEGEDDLCRQERVTQVEWDCPALGKSAEKLFCKLYGEERGSAYYQELNNGPNEVAAVARIFAYVQERAGALYEHS